MLDLGPAAREMSRLVQGVRDDQLDAVTPCPDWRLRDLLQHVEGFTTTFIRNARKQQGDPPEPGDLTGDWRGALGTRLEELAAAWQEEAAYQGQVAAGGVEMPAEHNAVVAVEELVVHGWDVARATGQPLELDDAALDGVERFLSVFADLLASGAGPYGPPVEVPAGAPRSDRVLAATGRDPRWSPEVRGAGRGPAGR